MPFVPVVHDSPADRLDDDYPIRLTTGQRLDSYNTGVQTAAYRSPSRRGEIRYSRIQSHGHPHRKLD